MGWPTIPAEHVSVFYAALPSDSRVDRRKMFGCPCAFVNGNMFVGLHGNVIILRLSDPDRDEMLANGRAFRFEPQPGRVMKEYVAMGADAFRDPTLLATDIQRAFEFAVAISPKARPSRKKKA